MPPAFCGKFTSIKLRRCPFCKPSVHTSNTNSKDGEIKWKYQVIELTGTHVEAGEPNDVITKTLLKKPEECSRYETPEMRTMCQCS